MDCRIDICGQKTWNDDNNSYGTRPLSADINLLRDGEVIKTLTVSSAGSGKYKFKCLLVQDKTGHQYKYSIDEAAVSGYTKRIQGFSIINTLDTMTISGMKIWNDNNNQAVTRPQMITVNLLQNGVLAGAETVYSPPSTQDRIAFSFANIPFADAQGKPYVYTIDEVPVAGYTKKIDGFNITNTVIVTPPQ